MTDTPLAAVVMAGGLGTRMRSAVPKHFHPILGRRMVDWVIETGRDGGRRPARRRRLARRRATSSRRAASTVAVQEQPLGTGDAVRSARAALEGSRRRRARALRRHAAAHRRAAAASSSTTHRRERRRRDDPQRRAARPARSTAASSATPTARCCASSREPTRAPRSSAIREINSSIYVFRSDALWPALEQLQPKNVQGELYLTDAIEILVARRRRRSPRTSPPTHRETDGVNTRVELAHAGAVLRDRINEAHMLAGVTIVDPQTTWIEPTVEIEPDVDDPAVHDPARRDARRRPAPRSARTRSRSTPTSGASANVGPVLLPSPRDGPRRVLQGGHLRGDQELTDRRPDQGVRTCRTSATPTIGEDTNIGAGAITANFAHKPGAAEGPHDDRQQRQDRRSTMASSRPSRSGTEHGSLPDRS